MWYDENENGQVRIFKNYFSTEPPQGRISFSQRYNYLVDTMEKSSVLLLVTPPFST